MILVTNELDFAHRLLDPRLSFDLNNFNEFIHAGEVSPKDMYELLTVQWEIEPEVALALINIYGGHIYDMVQAFSRLPEETYRFYSFYQVFSDGVFKCLDWTNENENDKLRMRDVLRHLAVTGFVPLKDFHDPIGRVICENDVGAIVKS